MIGNLLTVVLARVGQIVSCYKIRPCYLMKIPCEGTVPMIYRFQLMTKHYKQQAIRKDGANSAVQLS